MISDAVPSLSSAASAPELNAWPIPASGGGVLHLRLPAGISPAHVRLLDSVGCIVWQRQLAPSGAPWEGTILLPVTTGLYNLLY